MSSLLLKKVKYWEAIGIHVLRLDEKASIIFHYICGVKQYLLLLYVSLAGFLSHAQFAGPAETIGSTAMHRDSSAFVNWASQCQLNLGLVDIANPFSGFANSGDDQSPLGFPDGMCISLGDSGVATVTFTQVITNEAGPDFAVFENGFSDQFLELAFVEVSSDGVNFTRFPATSNTQTETQIGPFVAVGDATLLNNLAGKYRANFGTPFDLEDLNGTPGLDLTAITHVRVVDAVGKISGNHVQSDSNGHPINDPYPTAFPSCGFDLDAIGVIHQQPLSLIDNSSNPFLVFPNPVISGQQLHVASEHAIDGLRLISMNGTIVVSSTTQSLNIDNCPSGMYFLQIQSNQSVTVQKIIVH